MKRYVALALVALMVLGLVPAAWANDSIEDRIKFLQDQIDYMNENSVYSTVYTSALYVDLGGISNSGTVSTYVYSDGNPSPETGSFTVRPKGFNYAVDKLTHYILGDVANTYRQEPLNTEITMITYQKIAIPVYIYGEHKEQAISDILQGLYGCLNDGILPITEAMIRAKEELLASGKLSNSSLDHSILDMTGVAEGSVVSYTYSGENENLAVNNIDVTPIETLVAADKLTRFAFNLTNKYRPSTEISISFSLPDCETVNIYTYGEQKHEAMLAIISGIPDCLVNPRLGDGGSKGGGSPTVKRDEATENDWVDKYNPGNISFSSFKIGEPSYTTPDGTTKTMDVSPEISNERMFVPIRYLAYSLGVTDENITWDATAQTATLANDGTVVSVTINKESMLVNEEPIIMDVSPYIKQGRTMLPARWIAEPFGATVEWDEESQQGIIKPNPESGQGHQ